MKPFLFLGLAALLTASSCKKDDTDPNGLPSATQEGKNTGGFLLNGQPWLPKASAVGNYPYTVSAIYGPFSFRAHRLSISMFRYQDANNSQEITLYLAGVRQPGIYHLNQDINTVVISSPRPSYASYRVISGVRNFYTGTSAHGQVIITRLDTVARVVSGTFEANLKEDGGPDSFSITQGRFDCKF